MTYERKRIDMERIVGNRDKIMAVLQGFDRTKEYLCQISEFRKARSLDANAYYWVLLSKYADWAHMSKIRMHNEMLAHYGQELTIDGKRAYAVLKDTDGYLDLKTVHLKPTSQTTQDKAGNTLRTYVILRGSHEYDSKEMSILIDGLIQEIIGSDAPIETMTPAELTMLKGYAK